MEYLVKYTSKQEKTSSVVKNAFTHVVQKINDTNDIHNIFQKIVLKTVGQRDYSIQEVMHHLLSLKFVSATHEVVTASLDGSRRIQMTSSNTFCTVQSMLDAYAGREQYIQSQPDIVEYSFLKFVSIFTIKASKLQRRKRPVIVKTYPNYSSDPKNEHYGLFCKYQLLKYKPWKVSPDDAWDFLEQWDESYISC